MKVKVIGFEVQTAEGIPFGDFESHLEGTTQEPFTMKGHSRLFRCRKRGAFFEGVLLTLKQQKFFPLLQTETLQVTVHELEANQHLVDFNYFRWSSATRRGVMMVYHQSPGLAALDQIVSDQFNLLRTETIKEATPDGATVRAQAAIRKRFAGKVAVVRMLSQTSIEELLEELTQIDALEVDFVSVTPEANSGYSALSRYMKRRTAVLRFDPRWRDTSNLRAAVVSVAANLAERGGRVFGKKGQSQRSIDFTKNYDIFGEQEFETATQGVMMNLANWANSSLLGLLKQAMSDHEATFLAPTR